jgi:acylphosphatase
MDQICQRVVFVGHVQGVGFRYTTKTIADQHGMTGWVRNQPDGSVEMLACGEREALKQFIDDLSTRMASYIRQANTHPADNLESLVEFSIRR